MKPGWRDAPLALQDLALSNMPHSLNSQNPLSMTKVNAPYLIKIYFIFIFLLLLYK